MSRYETVIEDDTIYVGSPDGLIEVGETDAALAVVGGHSWEITYSQDLTQRHPELDTSDEGLIVDVVDIMHTMTHSRRFVETLAAQPVEATDGDEVSPRLGLFVGKLLEDLETGVS
ncbi:hypothetical protein SAMN05216226_10482 [Halovenus aranensis]|uniref:Uncharacterized protein n=1 Tax=Halovenus aranensis TaxID=890420 RepID=A0A1G8U6Q5_9EURY|nr:hypothetical protein [Halovenus aranensis]SDJ49403.1 hypothetical protein SAMN05216226_10482 [Halovenus aranensis]